MSFCSIGMKHLFHQHETKVSPAWNKMEQISGAKTKTIGMKLKKHRDDFIYAAYVHEKNYICTFNN